jgi:hypothetical protein
VKKFFKISTVEDFVSSRFGVVDDKFVLDRRAFSTRGFWLREKMALAY